METITILSICILYLLGFLLTACKMCNEKLEDLFNDMDFPATLGMIFLVVSWPFVLFTVLIKNAFVHTFIKPW